jgi:ketosteroid isomerase-like protein
MHASAHEIVQRWLAAVNAGDADAALALTSPEIRLIGPRGAATGHAVLRRWIAQAGATFEVRRTFARGTAVVVAQHGVWRDPATGAVRGEADVATRFRVADHQVVELQRFDQMDAALAGAGLSPADEVPPTSCERAI